MFGLIFEKISKEPKLLTLNLFVPNCVQNCLVKFHGKLAQIRYDSFMWIFWLLIYE